MKVLLLVFLFFGSALASEGELLKRETFSIPLTFFESPTYYCAVNDYGLLDEFQVEEDRVVYEFRRRPLNLVVKRVTTEISEYFSEDDPLPRSLVHLDLSLQSKDKKEVIAREVGSPGDWGTDLSYSGDYDDDYFRLDVQCRFDFSSLVEFED